MSPPLQFGRRCCEWSKRSERVKIK
ncbi:hypothetical protein SLEP1_g60520, partial [Rubroshorea leprosula]